MGKHISMMISISPQWLLTQHRFYIIIILTHLPCVEGVRTPLSRAALAILWFLHILLTNAFQVTNGTYRSAEMITSIIGNRYWVEIQLADGTVFKSDEEVLKILSQY